MQTSRIKTIGMPPNDLAEKLVHWLQNHNKIKAMTNAELVKACLRANSEDIDIINEMMTRLHPGWENEPD